MAFSIVELSMSESLLSILQQHIRSGFETDSPDDELFRLVDEISILDEDEKQVLKEIFTERLQIRPYLRTTNYKTDAESLFELLGMKELIGCNFFETNKKLQPFLLLGARKALAEKELVTNCQERFLVESDSQIISITVDNDPSVTKVDLPEPHIFLRQNLFETIIRFYHLVQDYPDLKLKMITMFGMDFMWHIHKNQPVVNRILIKLFGEIVQENGVVYSGESDFRNQRTPIWKQAGFEDTQGQGLLFRKVRNNQ